MLQINVANLPCEETTVSCRIVQTAVSDVAGHVDVMCHGMWHGMAMCLLIWLPYACGLFCM
jgi:hypothetical protein